MHLFLHCVHFEISWTNLCCQCHGLFSALNIEIGNWNMPFILVKLSSKLEIYGEFNAREESAVCAVGLGEFRGVLLCLAVLCTVDSDAATTKSRCNWSHLRQ